MRTIRVGNDETLVDDDMADTIEKMNLRAIRDRKRTDVKYVLYQNGKSWRNLSRFIVDAPDGLMVDHVNHNTLDNRRDNLRIVTNQQNQANSAKHRKPGHSKYKGVTFAVGKPNLSKKWQAGIYYSGKGFYIGNYETEELAALAYNEKAKELFGEYAHLNEVSV